MKEDTCHSSAILKLAFTHCRTLTSAAHHSSSFKKSKLKEATTSRTGCEVFGVLLRDGSVRLSHRTRLLECPGLQLHLSPDSGRCVEEVMSCMIIHRFCWSFLFFGIVFSVGSFSLKPSLIAANFCRSLSPMIASR